MVSAKNKDVSVPYKNKFLLYWSRYSIDYTSEHSWGIPKLKVKFHEYTQHTMTTKYWFVLVAPMILEVP